jgi:hypothetical protein
MSLVSISWSNPFGFSGEQLPAGFTFEVVSRAKAAGRKNGLPPRR